MLYWIQFYFIFHFIRGWCSRSGDLSFPECFWGQLSLFWSGNEWVDRLAKDVCELSPPDDPITYQLVKYGLKQKSQEVVFQRGTREVEGKKMVIPTNRLGNDYWDKGNPFLPTPPLREWRHNGRWTCWTMSKTWRTSWRHLLWKWKRNSIHYWGYQEGNGLCVRYKKKLFLDCEGVISPQGRSPTL